MIISSRGYLNVFVRLEKLFGLVLSLGIPEKVERMIMIWTNFTEVEIWRRMKQFENENCSIVLIKKWIIFVKLDPLTISTDETIWKWKLFNHSIKKLDNFCEVSSLEHYVWRVSWWKNLKMKIVQLFIIKKLIIFAKYIVPLDISSDETIKIKKIVHPF